MSCLMLDYKRNQLEQLLIAFCGHENIYFEQTAIKKLLQRADPSGSAIASYGAQYFVRACHVLNNRAYNTFYKTRGIVPLLSIEKDDLPAPENVDELRIIAVKLYRLLDEAIYQINGLSYYELERFSRFFYFVKNITDILAALIIKTSFEFRLTNYSECL